MRIFSFILFVLVLMVFRLPAQDATQLKLQDFDPVSVYKIPESNIVKAKFPVIDLHAHDYPKTNEEIVQWIETMKQSGIERTNILTYSTGARFDSAVERYSRYKEYFEVWCGFDYTGYGKPGWQTHAVAELERCFKKGAKGVGELGDKGLGEYYSRPVAGLGLHIDDPQMKPLLEKCADLHIPVSIHVAEDEWMYLKPDANNDGLMNAAKWHVDMIKKGILGHDQLVTTLENAVRANPKTTFIACHLANCCSDLGRLAKLFDAYPNLYADIAARYGEIAPIPRFVHDFLQKYKDRIVYGTDMGTSKKMYQITFRILESGDEHFYAKDIFGYHWPLYGLYLNDETLNMIYNGNARKILGH